MKKIKRFKINIRFRDVVRLLKNTCQIKDITSQIEEVIHAESRRLKGIVMPAAMFETHTKEKLPVELAVNPPDKWVAASLFLVTIGSGIENEISIAQNKDDNISGHVVHSIAVEALDQTLNFISRLLNEEAKDESCQLLDFRTINTSESLQKFFELMPGDKVGVQYTAGSDKYHPLYSTAGIVYWMPQKKQNSKGKN